MSIDIPLENWTKFPNCVLDNIDKYTPAEFKILAFMIRKNLGYDKPNKLYALKYLVLKTKMAKPTVHTAIKGLLQKDSITLSGKKNAINSYEVNWNEPKSDKFNILTTPESSKIEPGEVQKLNLLKDNKVKDNSKEDSKESGNSDFIILRDLYFKLYEKRFSQKPVFDGVEGKSIKNIIKMMPLNYIKSYLVRYMNTADTFCLSQGLTLKYFQQAIKSIMIQKQEKGKYYQELQSAHIAPELHAQASELIKRYNLTRHQIKGSIRDLMKGEGLI